MLTNLDGLFTGLSRALTLNCVLQTTPAGTTVVESLGDGGFSSDDFEVQQQLGQLSWVRV